jgi:hypothetical protein
MDAANFSIKRPLLPIGGITQCLVMLYSRAASTNTDVPGLA